MGWSESAKIFLPSLLPSRYKTIQYLVILRPIATTPLSYADIANLFGVKCSLKSALRMKTEDEMGLETFHLFLPLPLPQAPGQGPSRYKDSSKSPAPPCPALSCPCQVYSHLFQAKSHVDPNQPSLPSQSAVRAQPKATISILNPMPFSCISKPF